MMSRTVIPKGIIVTNDGEYEGVISEREVLQSHVEDDAKVAALTKPSRSTRRRPRSTARRTFGRPHAFSSRATPRSPRLRKRRSLGVITDDAILEAVLENLDALTVEDIYTDEPITLTGTMGSAKRSTSCVREHGISRLPVMNENGYLSGVVTTHDIADFVIRENHTTTTGDRVGDSDRLLDVPIYDIMTSPVETTTLDTSAKAAVEAMLKDDYAGLMVTPKDDDRVVIGVITKTDVLRALTFTEEEDHMDVQITNISMLDTITRGRSSSRASSRCRTSTQTCR